MENQIVEDVMNRNIDVAARQFEQNPDNPQFAVDQIRAYVYTRDKFDSVRVNWPEWYELTDGIYGMTGVDANGEPFSYKLRGAQDAQGVVLPRLRHVPGHARRGTVPAGDLGVACSCSPCCRCWSAGGRPRA